LVSPPGEGPIPRGQALTLIGATMRPCAAKKNQNRPVSKNNTGRAALWADPAGKNLVLPAMGDKRSAHDIIRESYNMIDGAKK